MMNKIEQKEKEYIRMIKRYDEVNNLIHNQPYRELDKPIHVGWRINFTLTPKGHLQSAASKWLEVIKVCDKGFTLHHNKASIVSKIREDKAFHSIQHLFMWKRLLDGRMVYGGPNLSRIYEKEYDKLPDYLKYRPFRWCYFNRHVTEVTNRWGTKYTTYHYTHNIPSEYLAINVKKRMVTHIQEIDPALVSEKKFLTDKLEVYWRHQPHNRGKKWKSKQRKIVKDAITHYMKGETKNEDIIYTKKKRTWD